MYWSFVRLDALGSHMISLDSHHIWLLFPSDRWEDWDSGRWSSWPELLSSYVRKPGFNPRSIWCSPRPFFFSQRDWYQQRTIWKCSMWKETKEIRGPYAKPDPRLETALSAVKGLSWPIARGGMWMVDEIKVSDHLEFTMLATRLWLCNSASSSPLGNTQPGVQRYKAMRWATSSYGLEENCVWVHARACAWASREEKNKWGKMIKVYDLNGYMYFMKV